MPKKIYCLESPDSNFEDYPIHELKSVFDDLALSLEDSKQTTTKFIKAFEYYLAEDPKRTDLEERVRRLKKLGVKILLGWKNAWDKDHRVVLTLYPKGELFLDFTKGFPSSRRTSVAKKIAVATGWKLHIYDNED